MKQASRQPFSIELLLERIKIPGQQPTPVESAPIGGSSARNPTFSAD